MTYDASWDRPHTPGGELDWQESDCYWFYDAKIGVGGFHRIGQKPNRGTGQLTLFVFAVGGSRFVINDSYTVDRPVSNEDRWVDGHQVCGHKAQSLGDMRMRYSWHEEQCRADLEFYESFYTPRGWSRRAGQGDAVLKNMNAGGHLECSGRIKGTLRIGNDEYTIDALAHRDRSWGRRNHSQVSYHAFRMFSGTVGPEFSCATFVLNPRGEAPVVSGYVVRNGIEEDIVDLRVLTTFDQDGTTALGGTAILRLESGEVVEVPFRTRQGLLVYFNETDAYVSDNISTIEYGGIQGFCDLEVGNNPRQGTVELTQDDVPLLAFTQGLSPSSSYDLLASQKQ